MLKLNFIKKMKLHNIQQKYKIADKLMIQIWSLEDIREHVEEIYAGTYSKSKSKLPKIIDINVEKISRKTLVKIIDIIDGIYF